MGHRKALVQNFWSLLGDYEQPELFYLPLEIEK